MNLSRKTIVIGALALVLAFGGISLAHAATGDVNPMNSLITALSQRFNLNPSDVQQVFTEQRSQMEAKREQASADRLTQAVSNGKLTQSQADAITAKQAEIKSAMAALKGKTKDEIVAAMKTQAADLKQWASDNSIPAGYMMFVGGKFGHMGFGPKMTGHKPQTQ